MFKVCSKSALSVCDKRVCSKCVCSKRVISVVLNVRVCEVASVLCACILSMFQVCVLSMGSQHFRSVFSKHVLSVCFAQGWIRVLRVLESFLVRSQGQSSQTSASTQAGSKMNWWTDECKDTGKICSENTYTPILCLSIYIYIYIYIIDIPIDRYCLSINNRLSVHSSICLSVQQSYQSTCLSPFVCLSVCHVMLYTVKPNYLSIQYNSDLQPQ